MIQVTVYRYTFTLKTPIKRSSYKYAVYDHITAQITTISTRLSRYNERRMPSYINYCCLVNVYT